MCLILLALDTHPDYALVVAANRDEFYDRPTARAGFWSDAPRVLAGRDLKAGGTWLGTDRSGRFAAVTNYRQGQREPEAPRSRGRLVADYLVGTRDGRAHIAQVEREAALYNGFNLIAGDVAALFYFSNRESRPRALAPGIYGLSNHLLDSPWPKVTVGKSGLTALLSGGGELLPRLFELLSDSRQAADAALPRTGVSAEWERLLSSAFIATEGYGTRSSTVVLVGRDGAAVFAERSFGPGGAIEGEVRYELCFEGPADANGSPDPTEEG
ncbi:MAG TPA: NRDE family protein [Gemmatimonadales bacterium]|nr:NRDE family protein [Gemmatimonadales bacterium]